MSQDINVVALVKGEERYIFLFNDDQKSETLRTLGRYASDSKLSFSWYDAAVLSQKVRNIHRAKPAVSGKRFDQPTNSLLPPHQLGSESDLSTGEDLFSGEEQR